MTASLRDLRQRSLSRILVLPLGIGNAFTSRYFNSSLLLIVAGRVILVDTPAPLRRVLADASRRMGLPLDLGDIDDIFLTHLHGDHCNGLEELGFFRLFAAPPPLPTLHVLESLAAPLWSGRLVAAMGRLQGRGAVTLEEYFQVQTFRCDGPLPGFPEGLRLVPRETNHLVPCAAFRLDWKGASLGYSADTEFDPTLFEFFTGCTRIIHEAGPGIGHTPLESLLGLPEDTRRRLWITHVPDAHDAGTCPLETLEEGRLYEVLPPAEAPSS